MEDLYSLIVLVAIIWSVIGRVFGGRRGPGGPGVPAPGRRPGAGLPERAPGGIPGPAEPREEEGEVSPGPAARGGPGAEDTSAAAMIPDDLWELLTGERRTPGPAWESESWVDQATWEEEGVAAAASPELAQDRYEAEARSLERIVADRYPVVVSLEAPPLPRRSVIGGSTKNWSRCPARRRRGDGRGCPGRSERAPHCAEPWSFGRCWVRRKPWNSASDGVMFSGSAIERRATAGVAELVDALDSKSSGRKPMRVRVPPSA